MNRKIATKIGFGIAMILVTVVGGIAGVARLSEWNRIREYKALLDSRANKTSAEGQYNLALSHQVEKDYPMAREWLRKSAEQGYLDALFILPDYYSSTTPWGVACGPDEVEQYAWLGVLANHVPGCYVGTASRAEQMHMNRQILERQLALQLSENQIEIAQDRETEYIVKYGCQK